ncbi:MAG: hypothetical protein K8R68_00950 [Bacteroidales bacterium]|nr:hypothetical protein [Bacteroidales bacterium]
MKKIYLSIIAILITFLSAFPQDPLPDDPIGIEYTEYIFEGPGIPNEPDFEETLNNVWIENEFGGIVPIDILALDNQNKIYVYGNNRLVILNSVTNERIGAIDISPYGQYMPKIPMSQIKYQKEKRLAYNNQNFLYCATESQEVLVIDVLTDEIVYTIPKPDGLPNYHWWVILKYYEQTNSIYWAFTILTPTSTISRLYIHEGIDDYSLLHQYDFDGVICDIAFNTQFDYFYLSRSYYLDIYNTIDYSLDKTIYSEAGFGTLLYVNNQQNQIHKLFGFSINTFDLKYGIAINGENNDDYEFFDLPGQFSLDACYDELTNSVCLSYGH